MKRKEDHPSQEPLESLDMWEEDLLRRYPEKAAKEKEAFRNYEEPARDTVKDFYRINHINQTYDFVLKKESEFLRLDRRSMSLWEAVEFLNTLVDDSDPDIDLDQTQHLLQTSEAIRADGHPDWLYSPVFYMIWVRFCAFLASLSGL